VVFELEAVAERVVDEPVYGFLVSNSSGAPILGTNSAVKKQRCARLAEGERVRLLWTVPNVFSDGRHVVDLSIHDTSGFTTYDYWKHAASFTVVKDEKTPYLVTPDTSFSCSRLDD
jgi:ABC-2 type transport system ATP-binding protein